MLGRTRTTLTNGLSWCGLGYSRARQGPIGAMTPPARDVLGAAIRLVEQHRQTLRKILT
jgi:hypothetical protein